MLNKPTNVFIAASILFFLSVIAINDGFMALDEYWVGVTRYIPAQTSQIDKLVGPDDVKSPLQMLPMHGVAQLSLAMGVTSPYGQYRCVIAVLAIVNVLLLIYAFLQAAQVLKLEKQQTNFLLMMLIFYFASGFSLTRPMYEAMAAPWLTLAAVWALRYDLNGKLKDLLMGVVFISVAFALRQQVGFCGLIFIFLPLLKKNLRHGAAAVVLGVMFFLLLGLPDVWLRGSFHHSLLSLTVYNYQHGADYGRKPLSFYPVMIFVMTLGPFFVKKYPRDVCDFAFLKLRSLWIILFLFVFLHSLFPQKWERFLISVIPLILLLLFPFLSFLQKNFRQFRWRLLVLYSINGLLFLIASFFPPQKNLIEMSRFLDRNPQFKTIYRVNNAPEWITEAFVLDKQFQFVETTLPELPQQDWRDCSKALVLAKNDLRQIQSVAGQGDFLHTMHLQAQFDVNWIEQVAYALNPKNNARRVQLNLYSGCSMDLKKSE